MAKKIKIGLKNKAEKIKLFNSSYDSAINDLGQTYINFTSNRKVVIDGCKGVIDYDTAFVSLNLGKKVINIFGSNLEILDFTENELTIIGIISRVEFGD